MTSANAITKFSKMKYNYCARYTRINWPELNTILFIQNYFCLFFWVKRMIIRVKDCNDTLTL